MNYLALISTTHARWRRNTAHETPLTVEMDSNPVENRIRPIALGRKNHLFAGHDEGGCSWALIASLVGTCRMNDIDPLSYLTSTLEAIANGHPQSRLDELLPGPFKRNVNIS
jgi:transposase